MAQETHDPGISRELGEQFKFIAEVTEIIPAENVEESSDRVNLISSAGRFGIIFIACGSFIRVFKTKNLIDNHENTPISTIQCRGSVTHVSTSCDDLTLLIVTLVNNCPFGIFYDVRHVMQMGKDIVPFYSVPLNTNVSSRIASISWNPCDATCVALAFSTGDVSLIKIKDTSIEFTNKNAVGANAVTWSAKGKQLAVGMKDGSVSLFKPDLALVRSIPSPSIQDVGPVFDITWFTNTEFFIAYLTNNVGPALMYVNAPKGKNPTFVNFDDVCYSIESDKPLSYYSVFISEWNLLFVFSSNGEELAIIGKTETEGDQFNWCLWSPDEGGKAIMHHHNVVEETFPLGLVIDFTSERRFPSKDETIKGPFPFLATVSTKGELNVFFIENYVPNSPPLNVPIENLPLSGNRTPEQFGQPATIELPSTVQETPPSELKQNFLSAFSSIPKKTEISSPTPLLFSTPIKPTFPAPNQAIKSVPQPFSLTGSTPTFASSVGTAFPTSVIPTIPAPAGTPFSAPQLFSLPSTNTSGIAIPSFSSPLISKPVSLSSQIGTTSLPAPSPQKSEIFQPLPSPSSKSSFSTPLPSQPKPTVSLPQAIPPPPSPKISKESVMYHIQKEEQQFEKELQELRSSVDHLDKEIGKDKDLDLKVSVEKIKDWVKAMKITTQDQSDEVGNLHQKTLEALALYEDANSHKQLKFNSRNEIYNQLRPLDPYSQRKLDEVRSKYQYLVSQISEVNTKMDLQWEEITALKKPKREQRSSTDNLYRSVLNLHTVRVSAERELEQAIHQLKKLNISPVLSSTSFNLADSRSEKLRDILNNSSNAIYSQSPSQSKSSERNRHLKEILAQRNHTPVRVHSEASPEAREKNKENVRQKVSLSECSTPLSNSFKNCPRYEDISPPVNRPQSTNPLAALSSLVGKVTASETRVSSTLPITSKADATSVGSFAFHQNKQQLPSVHLSAKKEVTSSGSNSNVGGLFGLSVPQSQIPNQQLPSFAPTGLFAGSKGATLPGFGSVFTSQPSSVSVPAIPISSGSKSPLFDILTTNKSSETKSGSATNFAQFFKGVTPASIPATLGGSLFSASVPLSKSVSSSGELGTTSVFASSTSSNPESGINFSLKQEAAAPIKVPLSPKESNVLCANPILSSHILKETSSIASSGGILGLTSSLFASGNKSSDVSLTKVSKDALPETSIVASNSHSSLAFGQSTTPSSVFTPTTGSSIFGKPLSNTSIFGQPTTSAPIFSQATTSTSIFGQSTSASIFGQPTTTTASIFAQPTTSTTSIFGQPTTSLFSQPSTNSSTGGLLFGNKSVTSTSGSDMTTTTATTTTTLSSPNGTFPSTQLSANSLIFSQSQTNTKTKLFGDQTAVTSSNNDQSTINLPANIPSINSPSVPSLFGGNVSASSIFGQSNSSSLFSAPSQTAVTSASVDLTQSGSVFGQALIKSEAKETSLATPSLFTNVSASLGSGSIFGKPSESNSDFGQTGSIQPVTTSSSLLSFLVSKDDKNSSVGQGGTGVSPFGMGNTPSTSAPQAIFGGGKPAISSSESTTITQTTSQNIFGGGSTMSTFGNSAVTTSTPAQSIFGGGPAASSNTMFGKPASEVTSAPAPNQSVFGVASSAPPPFQSSPFITGSVFGQSNASVPAAGAPSSSDNTGSVFGGQTASPFGNMSLNSGSMFGNSSAQATTTSTANIFGGGNGGSSSSSVFGANSSNSLFSQGNSGNSTPFGSDSMFSGLGKAPSKEDSSKNVFGTMKSEPSSQTQIFSEGGGSNSLFGGSFSTQKPAGAFSPVKSGSVFGNTSVFGGSPSLGDANKPKSTFGSGATFGGGATFGSNPIFGGSPSIGGGGGTTSVFGANSSFASPPPPPGNAPSGGFSSFASSGGATFGSLAHQTGPENTGFDQISQQGSNTGGSTIGGSSFTSWR